MSNVNDVTGDLISTGVSSDQYRQNFSGIFAREFIVYYRVDGEVKEMVVFADSAPEARRRFWDLAPSAAQLLEIV